MNPITQPPYPRVDLNRHATSAATRALLALQQEVNRGGLEASLVELVKIRASQLNGCAYCVDMHTIDARALGETEQRLHAIAVWHETPFFTPRERAALAWAESVTLLAGTHVPDDVYGEVRAQFDEDEVVALTWAIVAINAWNRLCVSFRVPAGTYRRGEHV